jgi:hypothetical protein
MMDGFEVVGYRVDSRSLYIDISYKDTVRSAKSLDAMLATIREETGAKPSRLSSDDAQRHAFNALLTQVLRFADEGNFGKSVPEKERYKKLRQLANSVNGQLTNILQVHRHRKIVTVAVKKSDDPEAMLKTLRKLIEK